MANLPLTGSQYWGAALNNYLRQINTDVTNLKLRLDNFTVSATYSGSGWVESTYNISEATAANFSGSVEALGTNTAVFKLKTNTSGYFIPTFVISGTLIFNSPKSGRSISITIAETQSMKLYFGSGKEDADDLRSVHQLSYQNGEYVVTPRGSLDISVLMPRDGYYPVYAIYDSEIGFIVALNSEQEFIFNENYVLLGIAMRSTDNGASSYYFARKTDSARKSIYETRKGNLEAFATIITADNSLAKGMFLQDTGKLNVILSSANIDYHSNGISNSGNSDGSSAADFDYKHPYDYKRFTASGRNCYITKTKDSEGAIIDNLIPITTKDLILVDGQDYTIDGITLEKTNIYGIYITALGDIILEVSNRVDTISDTTGYTNDYIWDLNSDSDFRTGGLVFLGAFFHAANGWKYMQPALNSISPAFISSKSVENANVVYLPDVTYISYPGGKVNEITPFRYNLNPPAINAEYSQDYYMLDMNAGYTPILGEDGYGRYQIPLMPSEFYAPVINSTLHAGIRLGRLLIEAPIVEPTKNILSLNPSYTIDSAGRFHGYDKCVISSDSTDHPLESLDSKYDIVLRNLVVRGNVLFETGVNAIEINRDLTNIYGITGAADHNFYLKTTRQSDALSNLYLVGATQGASSDTSFTMEAVTKIPDGSTPVSSNLTLKGSTVTLSASNKIVLASAQKIEVGNTLLFTSDKRCKHNIQDLDEQLCIDIVKSVNPKTFTYNKNNNESMGVIAQELEQFCSQYKDILINISEDEGLTDKRSVAETKLLFILWKAVQHLLDKEA